MREEGYLKIVPEVIEEVAKNAGVSLSEIDHVVLHGSVDTARALAKRLGIDVKRFTDTLGAKVGDCGVAQPMIMLSKVLAEAGVNESILVVGVGQGADAILLQTTAALSTIQGQRGPRRYLEQHRVSDNYTYFLSLRVQIDIDYGLRSERDNRTALSAYYRKRRDINSILGGRCRVCNTLQFPRSLVCVKCAASDSQDGETLSNLIGRVKSFTEDWLAYTPSPPYIYGNVEFADGANIMLEFTDFTAGQVKGGDAVRLVFRIKDFDTKRNFRRYFWKPAPLLCLARATTPTGHHENGIADTLRFQTARGIVMTETVGRVALAGGETDAAGLTEGFAEHQTAHELLRGPAFAAERAGEPVEQRGG